MPQEPKKIQLPRELIQAIEKNELIVFVGAGLSWGLKNEEDEQLEGWKNLVVKILLDLEGKEFEKAVHLRALIDTYDLITMLDLIERNKKFPKKEIANFIREFFYLKKDNDFSLHKKIYQLSNKIITTNYDRAFEIAEEVLERNTAYKGKNYDLATHKNLRASWLFKLHGCYSNIDSMVLFPSQYEALYDNNTDVNAKHVLATLHNIVYNKSVLFIGCGMGDFQINNIFSKIKKVQGVYNQNHFIITKYTLDSRLNFLIPIYIEKHNEIPLIIDRLLEEKEKFEQQKSPEVRVLEKQLADTKKQLKDLENIKDDAGRKDKLLEREALRYFERGLEFQLDSNFEKAINEYQVAIELNPNHDNTLSNWGTTLADLAKTKSNEEAENLYKKAIEKYENAIYINPNDYLIFYNLGVTLLDLAKIKQELEAEDLYSQAIEKFQKATEIRPFDHDSFHNWGVALGDLANEKSGAEAEILYGQAVEKFQKAIEIKPDNYKVIYDWGILLGDLANKKSGVEAETLHKEAIEKFQQAIELKPNHYWGFNGWGSMLTHIAKGKTNIEAETLYNQAIEKFQKAINIKPNFHQAFANWGIALICLTKIKSGKAAESLYYQAFEKFQKAIEIKPDYHEVLYNWGTNLLVLATTKSGEEAERLIKEALKKLQKAVDLGEKKYNLACAYALLSDKENALLYLEQSLKAKEVTTDHVLQDEDWQPYQNDKDFKKLIQKYKDK